MKASKVRSSEQKQTQHHIKRKFRIDEISDELSVGLDKEKYQNSGERLSPSLTVEDYLWALWSRGVIRVTENNQLKWSHSNN